MLIIHEDYSCCPFYTEVWNNDDLNEFLELQKNLVITSVLIINGNLTTTKDITKAKQIFSTDKYRITSKDMTSENLKNNLINLLDEKIKVDLSVVYKNYNGKNLQVVIHNILN
jgi:hypothetical protein